MSRRSMLSEDTPSSSSSSSSDPQLSSSHEDEDIEDEELQQTKNELFGSRRSQKPKKSTASPPSSSSTTAASGPSAERELERENARLKAEAEAALSSFASLGNLDVTTGLADDHDEEELEDDELLLDLDGLEDLSENLQAFQEDAIIKEALDKGVDLRAYSKNVEDELKSLEQACIQDYIAHGDGLADLHGQIQSCDAILQKMESMLSNFQGDLSLISSEISHLQERSLSMNVKLKNRKAAESELYRFIKKIFLSEETVHILTTFDPSNASSTTNTLSNSTIHTTTTVTGLSETSEPYVLALMELDTKIQYIEKMILRSVMTTSYQKQPLPLAVRDMLPVIERLKEKSVSVIRAFLLERIHSLKKPKTNIQIKQKLLLKFKFFYQFLLHHASDTASQVQQQIQQILASQGLFTSNHTATPQHTSHHAQHGDSFIYHPCADVAGEIRKVYHESMSGIYVAKFKKYLSEMKKLQQAQTMEKTDLLGLEEGSKSSSSGGTFSSFFSSKKSQVQIDNYFRLSNRDQVLQEQDKDLIIPHLALTSSSAAGSAAGAGSSSSASNGKIPFERIFRSAQNLLMDTATSEYDFIVEFFGERMIRDVDRAASEDDDLSNTVTNTAQDSKANHTNHLLDERGREELLPTSRDKHLFNFVFGKTIQLFLDHLDSHLFVCFDALEILILIRIICQHNLIMNARRVHCLDHVFDRMNMMLWPKFKQIFDANVDSVMKVPLLEYKSGKNKPHWLGLRYADFAAGILKLNKGYNDDILSSNLKRLRGEVDKLFLRSASRITPPKNQIIFLIQNFHAMLFLIQKEDNNSDEAQHLQNQAQQQIALYVEEELSEKFSRLIQFVKTTEFNIANEEKMAMAQNLPVPELKIDFTSLESLVKHFAKYWKEGIEQINSSVSKNFITSSANDTLSVLIEIETKSATEILKQVLVQLVLYYQRFQDLLKRFLANKNPNIRQNLMKDVVSISTIMFEIKKYSKMNS